MDLIASFVARNPVSVFFIALGGLLLLAGVLAWVLHMVVRRGHARYRHALTARSYLLLYIAAGGSLFMATMAVFAELAEALDADETLGRFDTILAGALHADLPESVLRALAVFTRLGDFQTLLVVGVVTGLALLVTRRYLLFWTWAVAVGGNGVLIRVLKGMFQRVRPLHDHGFVLEQGWSFPSGHASGSLVTYGMLAYLALRLWRAPWSWAVTALLVATFLAIGFSRIFLQVHYFSDVLAGFVSGAGWMAVCVTACEIVLARRGFAGGATVQKR